VALSQSNSILTYAGKLAGLVPSDPLQAALSDSVLNVIEDFWWYVACQLLLARAIHT
jgi:hypothetical protein